MKKILLMSLMICFAMSGYAQTEIDNFIVGPYDVDYMGPGDVKYRLRDGVDLFEFFELQKDTVINVGAPVSIPAKHAVQITGLVGANRYVSKIIGLEGVWKQNIGNNLYFNGGVSLGFDISNEKGYGTKRTMFEFGIPLQIELGKLDYYKPSVYGLFGLKPTIYSTVSASHETAAGKVDDPKKSGFLLAPSLEFGGNVPVNKLWLRFGFFAEYKINCTVGDYNIYNQAGKFFLGARFGVIL